MSGPKQDSERSRTERAGTEAAVRTAARPKPPKPPKPHPTTLHRHVPRHRSAPLEGEVQPAHLFGRRQL